MRRRTTRRVRCCGGATRSESSSASSSAPGSIARRRLVAGVTGDAGWMLVAWIAGAVISRRGRAVLRRARERVSARRRRLPLPHARVRPATRASSMHGRARRSSIRARSRCSRSCSATIWRASFRSVSGGAAWALAIVVALTCVNIVGPACVGARAERADGARGARAGRRCVRGLRRLGAAPGRPSHRRCRRCSRRTPSLGTVGPRDGVRAAHVRRLERRRVHVGRTARRAARDRDGAARRASRS